MSRQFITAIALSAVVATGLSSAQARAGEHDTARALVGITAVLLLGKALSDRKDDRNVQVTRGHGYIRHHGNNNGHNSHNNGHGNAHNNGPVRVDPRPLPPRVRSKILPRQCLTTLRSRSKNIRILGAQCLQNNYRFSNTLPRKCSVKVKTNRGNRFGFAPNCLQRHGYSIRG
ncbi:hypothetical protein KO498_01155 [Lentibacter algarum]|uniref:hypothetical protein n=1 Tax=Lentibacter algarum TaxID=576131 RepID=UPI001C0708B0|nr:hypothetical protein [Lentibacter algarum]MBU2980407.1 hypothetical protein [Lentibacter algarum]